MKTGDLVCVKGLTGVRMSVRYVRTALSTNNGQYYPVAVTCTWFKVDGSIAEFGFKYEQLIILKEF